MLHDQRLPVRPHRRNLGNPAFRQLDQLSRRMHGRSSYQTYSKMARLATSVATAASAGSTYAQRRAISLDMTKTLAVIALLRCCRLSVVPFPRHCGTHGPWIIWGSTYSRSYGAAGSRSIHALNRYQATISGRSREVRSGRFLTYQAVCLFVGSAKRRTIRGLVFAYNYSTDALWTCKPLEQHQQGCAMANSQPHGPA